MTTNTPSHRPFIIPVFLPHHGCPHRCTFCNQTAITGIKEILPSPAGLKSYIEAFLEFKTPKRQPVQIAFYGGNFLGLAPEYIKSALAEATRFVAAGKVDGIRFSTRPDTIDRQRLDIIANYPVSTIEIGAQSMDDMVLDAANRGHTAKDTENAAALLKTHAFKIGIQMMVGLPNDDEAKSMATGRRIAALGPDFVRIYPTLVLAGSGLAKQYQAGRYRPWPLERCVSLVKQLFLLFKAGNIAVVRMGLQPSEDLEKDAAVLAGPYHPAFGHLVYSEVFLDRAAAAIAAARDNPAEITLKVHPNSVSKMRGLKNRNILLLKNRFGFESIRVFAEPALTQDQVILSY